MARVSEPAKALSEISTTFAPILVRGSKISFVLSGPIERTVTSSDNVSAHSSAEASNGFISPLQTFTHTSIFIRILRYK